MGKIGKKLSNILSKDKGQAKSMLDFSSVGKGAETIMPDKGAVFKVPVSDLKPNSLQPRKVFNEEKLEDLAKSIKEKGIIQHITFRNTNKGKEIIAGERRWRAAQIAGLKEIPAVEMNVNDEEALELAIVENIQRDDLNPIEKGQGFKTLIDSYKLTQEKVADVVGISRTAVTNYIRLLGLPPRIKEHVSRETLTMGHARCLLSMSNPEKQISLANRIVKQGLSVRQVEEIVYGPEKEKKQKKKKEAVKDPHVADLEKKFKEILGTKVSIKNKKRKGTNKGSITIEYYNNEDFRRIAEKLGVKL